MTTLARDATAPCQRFAAPKLKYPSASTGRVLITIMLGRVDEPAVVVGDLAEVARDVVLQSGVALLAVVAAEVPVEEVEVLAVGIGLDNRSRSHAQARRECSRCGARRSARPAPGRTRRAGRAPRRSRASLPNGPARPQLPARCFGPTSRWSYSSAQRSCPTLRQWGRAEAQGGGDAARQKFWERWVHDEHRQAHDDASQRERGPRRLAGAAAHAADVVQDRVDGEGNGARRAHRRSGRRGEPPSRPDDHLPARSTSCSPATMSTPSARATSSWPARSRRSPATSASRPSPVS